jgi:hypothetical protein
MITHIKEQEIEIWDAWIEYDPTSAKQFGTIYLMGEIQTTDKANHEFFIKEKQAAGQSELVLTINPDSVLGRGRYREVIYAEPIRNLNQYRSIRIMAGDELLTVINDIEVLV